MKILIYIGRKHQCSSGFFIGKKACAAKLLLLNCTRMAIQSKLHEVTDQDGDAKEANIGVRSAELEYFSHAARSPTGKRKRPMKRQGNQVTSNKMF